MPDIDIDFSVRGRERVIRYVTEKYGADRVAQIITFGKMFPRAATRDAARVLGPRLRRRRPAREADPGPDHGPPAELRGLPAAGRRPRRRGTRRDPTAKQIVDVARGLEGIVRNASIHAAAVVISDRPLTDIVPLQLADAGTDEDGAEGLPHGHPVLDEADRGDRPAQDGLPRPAQPRRDRGRAGHHRALDAASGRTWRRCRSTTRRPTRCSPAATRSACSSSSPRACARRCKKVRPDRVRGPRRARRALPPGRDGPDPDLRPRQAQPRDRHLHRRAPAPDHRGRRRA